VDFESVPNSYGWSNVAGLLEHSGNLISMDTSGSRTATAQICVCLYLTLTYFLNLCGPTSAA
jgi:hypothetical protein